MTSSAPGAPLRAANAAWLWLVLCLCALPARGSDHFVSLSLEELLRIEVTGPSRFAQPSRDAPSTVTVITREEIRDHAWHTLADILDAVPGVFVATDRVYRYAGVRGFLQPSDYNTNVLLLIDGIPANDALYNQAFLGTEGLLDVAVIERVEFIPGPGSSAYGSNAILGVINVVTTTGRRLRGTAVAASAGRRGERGIALRHGLADDGRDLLIFASGWRSDGETVTLPDTDAAGFGRARGLDHDRYRRVMGRHAWGEFTLLGAYSERRKGYATAPFGTLFGDPRTIARDDQLLLALSHQAEWRSGVSVLARASLGAVRYRADWAYAPPDDLNRDAADGRWWGVELQATDTRSERHTLVYGFEFRNQYRLDQRNFDVGREPRVVRLDDQRRARQLGAYVQDEWRTGDWRLSAGLRLDYYSRFGTMASPRLAAIQSWSPQTTVKYIFGTAYRAPNAFEAFYHDGDESMKANPGLHPERIRSLEVAVEHFARDAWHWSGSVFHNRLRQRIAQELDPHDGLLVYRNRGDASTHGVTLTAQRRWRGGHRVRLSASWHDSRDHARDDRLSHSPRVVAKLDATVPIGAWRATIEGRHVGARTSGDGRVGGQSWGNLALVSSDRLPGGARIALRIDNLFDRRLFDPASDEFAHDRLPREGRIGRLTVAWPL